MTPIEYALESGNYRKAYLLCCHQKNIITTNNAKLNAERYHCLRKFVLAAIKIFKKKEKQQINRESIFKYIEVLINDGFNPNEKYINLPSAIELAEKANDKLLARKMARVFMIKNKSKVNTKTKSKTKNVFYDYTNPYKDDLSIFSNLATGNSRRASII